MGFLFQHCNVLSEPRSKQTEETIKKKSTKDFSMIQLMPIGIYCFLDENYQTLLGLFDGYEFVIHNYSNMIGANWTGVEAEITKKNNGIMLYVSGLDSTNEELFQKDSLFFSQRKIELILIKSDTRWDVDVDEDENLEITVIASNQLKLEIRANGNWQQVSYQYVGNMVLEKNREVTMLPNDDVPLFIYNSNGEKVFETLVGEMERVINLSHLEKGLYIFKCKIHGIDFADKRMKM
jgi:hypothetical protein